MADWTAAERRAAARIFAQALPVRSASTKLSVSVINSTPLLGLPSIVSKDYDTDDNEKEIETSSGEEEEEEESDPSSKEVH